eukprot:scaffold72229_cov63-Phaeocystis_antarctica.AAC.3
MWQQRRHRPAELEGEVAGERGDLRGGARQADRLLGELEAARRGALLDCGHLGELDLGYGADVDLEQGQIALVHRGRHEAAVMEAHLEHEIRPGLGQ